MWLVSQYALFLSENLLELAERLCKHLVHKLQITGRQTVLLTQKPLEEHSAEWDVQLGTWQHTHEMSNWEHHNKHMGCPTGNMTKRTHGMSNWEHDNKHMGCPTGNMSLVTDLSEKQFLRLKQNLCLDFDTKHKIDIWPQVLLWQWCSGHVHMQHISTMIHIHLQGSSTQTVLVMLIQT